MWNLVLVEPIVLAHTRHVAVAVVVELLGRGEGAHHGEFGLDKRVVEDQCGVRWRPRWRVVHPIALRARAVRVVDAINQATLRKLRRRRICGQVVVDRRVTPVTLRVRHRGPRYIVDCAVLVRRRLRRPHEFLSRGRLQRLARQSVRKVVSPAQTGCGGNGIAARVVRRIPLVVAARGGPHGRLHGAQPRATSRESVASSGHSKCPGTAAAPSPPSPKALSCPSACPSAGRPDPNGRPLPSSPASAASSGH